MANNPFAQYAPKPPAPAAANPFAQYAPSTAPPAAPEPEDESSAIGLLGRGVAHGTMGMGESIGIGLDWIGAEGLGNEVEEYFKAKREGFAPPEHIRGSVVKDPGLMADLDWWAFNVGSIFPTLAASIVPGIGAAKGVQYGAKALGYLKSGDLAAKMHRLGKASQYAGATVGGLAGGALEGTHTYREIYDKAIEKGGSEEEARAAASSGGLQMIAASGVLNAASVSRFLKTLPKTQKGKLVARTVRAFTEGVTEWLEGPAEAGIMMGQDVMSLEEAVQKTIDEVNVFGPSFVVGFIMPGAGRLPTTEMPKTPEQKAAQKGVQEQAEVAGIAPERLAQIEAQTKRDAEDLDALERGEPLPEPGSIEARDRTLRQESRAQVAALEGEIGASEALALEPSQEAQPSQATTLAPEPSQEAQPSQEAEVLPAPSAATHLRTQGRGVASSVLGMGTSGAESLPIPPISEAVDEETARATAGPLGRVGGVEPSPVPSGAEAEVTVPQAKAPAEAAPSPPAGEVTPDVPRGATELDIAAAVAEPGPVDMAAAEAAPQEASAAQIEAGTYKKGHVSIGGMDVSIEHAAGTKRRPEWPTLKSHYGYFRRTEGKDGDQVDAFIKPGATLAATTQKPVFVVDQARADGVTFDEHKAMVGFDTIEEARDAYLANYTKDWNGLKAITQVGFDEFKQWATEGDTKAEFSKALAPEPSQEADVVPEDRSKPSAAPPKTARERLEEKREAPEAPVSPRERLDEKKGPAPEPKGRSLKLIKMPPEEVEVAETGETATITESADAAINRVDEELQGLYQLKRCLSS